MCATDRILSAITGDCSAIFPFSFTEMDWPLLPLFLSDHAKSCRSLFVNEAEDWITQQTDFLSHFCHTANEIQRDPAIPGNMLCDSYYL